MNNVGLPSSQLPKNYYKLVYLADGVSGYYPGHNHLKKLMPEQHHVLPYAYPISTLELQLNVIHFKIMASHT